MSESTETPVPTVEAKPPVNFTGVPTDAIIGNYIRVRDKIAEIKKQQSDFLKPFNEMIAGLEAEMLRRLNEQGLDNMKSSAGTAYKSTRTSAMVKEWSETLQFIRDNDAFDLLEARVSKTAVLSYVEEKGAPVPGVAITQDVTLNVRKA